MSVGKFCMSQHQNTIRIVATITGVLSVFWGLLIALLSFVDPVVVMLSIIAYPFALLSLVFGYKGWLIFKLYVVLCVLSWCVAFWTVHNKGKATVHYSRPGIPHSEKNNFKKKQKSSITKTKRTGFDKQQYSKPTNQEQVMDDSSIPERPHLPKKFRLIKEGASIVSLKDQPIPDELRAEARRFQQQMEDRGYVEVSEDEVNEISNYLLPRSQKYMQSYEEAADSLVSEPIDIGETPFDAAKMIGAMTGGVLKDGEWTALTRVFEFEDFGLVKLDDSDYIAAGSGIQLTKESINESVNGNAAIYTVQVSPSGKALTEIIWVTNSKNYSLSMEKNASTDEKLKEDFLNLARSLPTESGSFSLQDLSDNSAVINDSSESIAAEPPPTPHRYK